MYTVGDQVAVDWSTNASNKSIYTTALAAHLAGQKVGLRCHRLLFEWTPAALSRGRQAVSAPTLHYMQLLQLSVDKARLGLSGKNDRCEKT